MAPQDDLKTHALSTTDFYTLLDLPESCSSDDVKSLDRAWRRTALKYHPDKVGPNNTEAQEKFHLANIGYELLRDPTLRELYDRTRAARLQKERQRASLAESKRRAIEDLEARESAARRDKRRKRRADDPLGPTRAAWDSSDDEEERKNEAELRRLAEDGRRRVQERAERLRRERQEATAATKSVADNATRKTDGQPSVSMANMNIMPASEMDRTVKVRFNRTGAAQDLKARDIEGLFRSVHYAFGEVELAFDLKDKKTKSSESSDSHRGTETESKSKTRLGTVAVVFHSLMGALAAVEKWRRFQERAAANEDGTNPLFASFQSVDWANGKEPEVVKAWADAAESGAEPSKNGGPSADDLMLMRLRCADKRRKKAAEAPRSPQVSGGSREPSAEPPQKKSKPAFSFSPAGNNDDVGGNEVTGKKTRSVLDELKQQRLRHEEQRRLLAEQLDAQEAVE